MYPHKHNLLFIFIVLLSLQTSEAKNFENKYTDLNSKNTTTVSDFSNILNSPINLISQDKEEQVYGAIKKYNKNQSYNAGDIVYYNCMTWEKINNSPAGTEPGNSYDAWEFVEYYDQGDCTFYNGVLEYDANMIYPTDMEVYYNCTIWKKINKSGAGTTPGKSYGAWEFVNYYDGGNCTFYNGVPEFDKSMTYQPGMKVYYDNNIWEKINEVGSWSTPGESEYNWSLVEEYKLYDGAEKYIEEVVYQPETEIYFNCTLWKKVDNSPAGTAPGANNDAWEFVRYFENSNECTFINGVPEYDDTMTYLPGMEVYYDGNVWVNNTTNQKISGDTPNFNNSKWSAQKSLSVADDILKENITLYYNSNRIYYDFSKLENSSQIVCYDVKGSLIFSKEINNDKDAIDLPSIQQGLYFLQVLNNNAKTFKKIIVL
ncbi:T9SS type A sorting domain-containing protein [Lutibacter sp. A64]|uniref:T9SS type A sorting domain-containing protein n=1 Tax=Lutibacter sp. A64 TaxID=2918526 RepID=UPI001F052604|nr:T9SS type A sorting domain-containing protein [Lutibacter sp. A64]UMB54464.1 T9SS type A sorting domain-containing protein [Lutibacter sp. A64]